MVTYYCPSCWAEIHENTEICPHCEFNIGAFGDLEYEQKLINAAFHPIPENRCMAVEALGMLKTPRALPTLARILHEEKDTERMKAICGACPLPDVLAHDP